MAETPQSRARHLLTILTDDSAIIAHVKRDFNYIMDRRELNAIRKQLPRDVKLIRQAAAEPIRGNDKAIQVAPADPLLKALAAYHLKYTKLDKAGRDYYQAIA